MNDKIKTAAIAALRDFLRRRPGLDPADYGSEWRTYRATQREVIRDRKQAEAMLDIVEHASEISGEAILEASRHAYSGRLTMELNEDGSVSTSYCTGQYFPTEYRKAVCAILAGLLRSYWWPAEDTDKPWEAVYAKARTELGRGIAADWFR